MLLKILLHRKLTLVAVATILFSLVAGFVNPWLTDYINGKTARDLYCPPSPTTIWGAKSGAIGYTGFETGLINIEDIGCSSCNNSPSCVLCGLQYNSAGVYCCAYGLYRRASKHFQKACEIEEKFDVAKTNDDLVVRPISCLSLKFRQGKGEDSFAIEWRGAEKGHHSSHLERLSGYLHNLEWSKSKERYQTNFYKPTLFMGSMEKGTNDPKLALGSEAPMQWLMERLLRYQK